MSFCLNQYAIFFLNLRYKTCEGINCNIPDEYRTVEEKIMVKPAYTKLEIVPATYKTIEEKVLVKEASKRYVYVPAVYETTEVAYVGKASRTDLSIVPASFGPSSDTREVFPAITKIENRISPDCKSPSKDCYVLCTTEMPATSKTINVQKLSMDASTSNVPVSEQGATYKRQVIKTAARMDEVMIPDEYATIKKQVVDQAATTRKVMVDTEYTTIKRTELVKKGSISKETIDCKLTEYNALPILYPYNSAALIPEAKRTIDEALLELLNAKPNVSVEIRSHTDSRGSASANETLSQRRAESVVNYLINKGINRSRLVAKGLGEGDLKNRCADGVECSEAEHQVNRRNEFTVF